MPEFFINARTFAAPFVSETIHRFVKAETAGMALLAFIDSKPAGELGVYAAEAYSSADAMHKGDKPITSWHSNHARAVAAVPCGTMYCSNGPGCIEVGGETKVILNPKGGALVE